MNKSTSYLWLACFVITFFVPVAMCARGPSFNHLTTKEGLPSPEVYDVGFDEFGRPWFCTDRGLCCFDGYELHTYTMEDGLSSNTLLGVCEGLDGKLWFNALDGSMNCLSGRTLEAFWGNSELLAKKPSDLSIKHMAPGRDGRLYLSFWTHDEPVFGSFDPEKGDFRIEQREELERRFELVRGGTKEFLDLGGARLPLGHVGSPVFLPDGRMFHTEFPGHHKIFKSHLGKSNSEEVFRTKGKILQLVWEADKGLWAATSKGLLLFEGGDFNAAPRRFLDGVAVSRLGIGPDGSYWLPTLEEGVYWTPSLDVQMLELQRPDGGPSRITSLGSLDRHLVCGTLEGRIFMVDEDIQVEEFAGRWLHPGLLAHGTVRNGKMFLGEYDLQEKNGKVEVRSAEDYRFQTVRMELANGSILHGGEDGYVVVENGKVIYESKGWPHRVLSCLEVGETIYLATVHGLFAIRHGQYDQAEKVLPDEPLLKGQLNHLCADEWGNLWISSIGGGLIYLSGDRVYHFRKGHGLLSNQVNRSRTEPGGILWAATNCGLIYMKYDWDGDFELEEARILTRDDGLPDNYIQDVAPWNGKVWLATEKGLHFFDPPFLMARKTPPPKVILEEVLVNGRQYMDSPGLNGLSHRQNDIFFRFLGISMHHTRGYPRYRYRISGGCFPSIWTLTNDRTVRFLNLDPGDYTFEVQARNRQGDWSLEPAICHFSIRPHFSQQRWFQGLTAFMFMSVVGSALMYRARRYRKRVEIQRRLQEAEISALRSQMNPHFVFNSLNAIQNFVFRKDILKANYFLSRFSRLMREGLLFSRSSTILLTEELEFLQAYLELEKMRFPDRFDFEVAVDEAIDPQKVCLPPFLCQPLLENAIKHGFKEIPYRGQLQLHFELASDDMLRVMVRDNGSGLVQANKGPAAAYHDSMGLKIVRDRIALLNMGRSGPKAIFELDDRPEGGVLAWFTLPLMLRP